jgi:hypothetical protein
LEEKEELINGPSFSKTQQQWKERINDELLNAAGMIICACGTNTGHVCGTKQGIFVVVSGYLRNLDTTIL